MKDLKLSKRGKAAYASLCVACCGFPMLIVLGIISIGAAFTIGVSLASGGGVAVLAYLVIRHRTGHIPSMLPRMLGVGGVGLAAIGFWRSQSVSVAAVSVSIAMLAVAALLVAADVDFERSPA